MRSTRLSEAKWERRLLGYASLLADAALEPDLFSRLVDRLKEDYPVIIGMLGYDASMKFSGEAAFANVEAAYQRSYSQHFAQVNPYPRVVKENQIQDKTVFLSRFLPPSGLRKTEYFNDFLRPVGGGEYLLALSVEMPGFGRTSLTLGRSEEQGGEYDDTDLRRLDSLRPFLRNTMLLRALWREAGCPKGDPAQFVRSLRSAALILKREGHAEPLNEAAERKLSKRSSRGRIDLTQGTLESEKVPPVESAAPSLRRFLQDKFRLTATQTVVASALVDGLSYAEIADEYGISTETVKSHVKAIHEKTGVHSTLRFLALLNSLRR